MSLIKRLGKNIGRNLVIAALVGTPLALSGCGKNYFCDEKNVAIVSIAYPSLTLPALYKHRHSNCEDPTSNQNPEPTPNPNPQPDPNPTPPPDPNPNPDPNPQPDPNPPPDPTPPVNTAPIA
ncbi:MAG: hypothetical protein AAB866_02590, partial [Patescibacteria group bacterium]